MWNGLLYGTKGFRQSRYRIDNVSTKTVVQPGIDAWYQQPTVGHVHIYICIEKE